MGGPQRYDKFLKFYKFRDFILLPPVWMTNIPIVKKLAALMPAMPGTNHVNLTYIPVNTDIEAPPGTVAPISIMEEFIKKASYHVIMNSCPCRTVAGCKDYPIDYGCTFLGEGARDINPAFSRHVSMEEALDYFHKTVEAGLTPALGRFIMDAWMVGIKDDKRMMTMCHCCPCCCLATYLGQMPGEVTGVASNMLVKLEGVSVEVTDDCVGCGKCVEKCMFQEIKVIDGKAVISDYCKGCGRCATVCPNNAITVKIDNPDFFEQAVKRISKVVDVT